VRYLRDGRRWALNRFLDHGSEFELSLITPDSLYWRGVDVDPGLGSNGARAGIIRPRSSDK
jgi:hypothetical protein